MNISDLSNNEIIALRKEIVLNSLFLKYIPVVAHSEGGYTWNSVTLYEGTVKAFIDIQSTQKNEVVRKLLRSKNGFLEIEVK